MADKFKVNPFTGQLDNAGNTLAVLDSRYLKLDGANQASWSPTNTLVTNLNADLLDGNHASAFALSGHTHAQLHDPATVLDSSTIDFTLTGQQITGSVIQSGLDHGSIGGLADDDHSQYIILTPTTDARNVIQPSAATVKGLVIKGAASQSDTLQEWQSSTGSVLASVKGDGSITQTLTVTPTTTYNANDYTVNFNPGTNPSATFSGMNIVANCTPTVAAGNTTTRAINAAVAKYGTYAVQNIDGFALVGTNLGSGLVTNMTGGNFVCANFGAGAIANATNLIGNYVLVYNRGLAGTATTTTITGLKVEVQNQAQFGGTATATSGYGVLVMVGNEYQLSGTASLTNAYLFYGRDYVPSATNVNVTNLYGLYLESMTKGATLNYSIYTNLGDCRIGDDLILNAADSDKIWLGAGKDFSIYYDGTSGYLKTSDVAASDLHVVCGAQKTLVLDTPVYEEIRFYTTQGRTPAANAPTWEAFTTNTSAFAFGVDDYIDCTAEELPHWWSEGTAGDVHIHFANKTAQSSGANRYAKFTVWIGYSDINEAWVETSFTAEYTIPTGTAALTHMYLDMGNLTLTNYKIGGLICVRVKRIAATGGTEYADDVYINQVGIHLLKDTLGSRQEAVK